MRVRNRFSDTNGIKSRILVWTRSEVFRGLCSERCLSGCSDSFGIVLSNWKKLNISSNIYVAERASSLRECEDRRTALRIRGYTRISPILRSKHAGLRRRSLEQVQQYRTESSRHTRGIRSSKGLPSSSRITWHLNTGTFCRVRARSGFTSAHDDLITPTLRTRVQEIRATNIATR